MLVHIPAFQMHDVGTPNAGERKSCFVVNNCDLKPRESADLLLEGGRMCTAASGISPRVTDPQER